MICSGVGSVGVGCTLATSYSGLPLKNSSIHSCISFTGIRLRKSEWPFYLFLYHFSNIPYYFLTHTTAQKSGVSKNFYYYYYLARMHLKIKSKTCKHKYFQHNKERILSRKLAWFMKGHVTLKTEPLKMQNTLAGHTKGWADGRVASVPVFQASYLSLAQLVTIAFIDHIPPCEYKCFELI